MPMVLGSCGSSHCLCGGTVGPSTFPLVLNNPHKNCLIKAHLNLSYASEAVMGPVRAG